MKKFIFSTILLGLYFALNATPIQSTIKEVTVFRSGAKVSSVATVQLAAGRNEIVFENLSPYFNGNSLQVKISGGATLNSAIFRLNTPGPAPQNIRVRIVQDSLQLLADEIERNNDESSVLQKEENILLNNSSKVGTTGQNGAVTLSTAELIALSEAFRKRNLEIKQRLQALRITNRKVNDLITRLNQELANIKPNVANSTGEIVLSIESETLKSVEITCSYIVSGASWTPLYDLRTDGFGLPLQLAYKANVRNQTGFDWKNIDIHLSSAQPLANNNRPILNPLYVQYKVYASSKTDKKKEAMSYNLKAEDVNIKASSGYHVDGVRVNDKDGVADAEEGNTGDFSVNFDIPKKQDILSNGKDNILLIEKQEIPAIYEYHCVPKLDPGVFLLAKITDYGQYNLLPGTANLFLQDNFVGQAYVNPLVTTDTLLLSLGRDEQLVTKRQQPKEFKERRKILSSTVREISTYEIEIKNNKPAAVTVNVFDQIPISKLEAIVVELGDHDGANYNAELGSLEWNVAVPPNKSKKIRFTYTTTYPKGKEVGTN